MVELELWMFAADDDREKLMAALTTPAAIRNILSALNPSRILGSRSTRLGDGFSGAIQICCNAWSAVIRCSGSTRRRLRINDFASSEISLNLAKMVKPPIFFVKLKVASQNKLKLRVTFPIGSVWHVSTQ